MGLSILAKLGMDSSEFKKGLGNASRETSSFGKKITSAITSATKIAGAALAGMAIKGTMDMVQFQKGISEVFTLLPGISKGAMGEMEKDVRELAQTMGLDLNDAVKSLYQAISAGVDPGNAIDFLKTSAKTAIGGIASLEDTVGALTTVINGYGMSMKEASRVSDVLFSVVKNGVTNMTELGQNIGKVTPIAASLGVTIEEVGAMFAVLTKQMGSGKTAEAGTAIRSMLAELAKEGMKANKNFKELGKGGFKEFIANGGQVGEALMLMKENAEASGKSLMDLFRGVEAGNGALMLVTNSGKELSQQLKNVQGDAGATEVAFGTMEKTVSRQFDKLFSNLKEMGLKIGEAFLPVLNDLIPRMSAGMKDFAPKVAEVARTFASVTSSIIELAPAIGKVIVGMAAYTIGVKASAVATALLGKSVRSLAPHMLVLWGAFELGKVLGDGLAKTWKHLNGTMQEEWDNQRLVEINKETGKIIDRMTTLDEKIIELKKSLGLIKIDNPMKDLEKLDLRDQVEALREMANINKDGGKAQEIGIQRLKDELEVQIEIFDAMQRQGKSLNAMAKQGQNLIELREKIKKAEFASLRHMEEGRNLAQKIVDTERERIAEIEKRNAAEADAEAKRNKAYAMSLQFEDDMAKAIKATREEVALSKTEAGKIVLLGRERRDLEQAKLDLINKVNKAQKLSIEDANKLRNIEGDILNNKQATLDIIKNSLKQARTDELTAIKDVVAELQNALDVEDKRAKAAQANVDAKEAEVQALRDNLKDAQKDLEEFEKFFNKDFKGDLKIDKGELREEFKALKEAGELPEGVRTMKDFEDLTRKRASEALKRRNEIIEEGKLAKAQADALRAEEDRIKMTPEEKQKIEDDIAQKKLDEIKLENDLEEEKKKTVKEWKEEREEWEKILKDLHKVNVLPEFDANIVEAIATQAENLKTLDHNVAGLVGRNGSISVDLDLDDSDINKETTQVAILETLEGKFVNQ